MQNYQISNEQITASSEYDGNHAAFQGRLHFKGAPHLSASWSARTNDVNQWLQVDVGSDYAIVTRVATQGRDSAQQWSQWVTKYTLQFSYDSVNFQDYKRQRQTNVSKHTFSQLPPRGITWGLILSALLIEVSPKQRVREKDQKTVGVKPNIGVRLTIPILGQAMARLINSIDEILWCCHSNETFPAELLHNAKYFSGLFRQKFTFLILFGHYFWWKG